MSFSKEYILQFYLLTPCSRCFGFWSHIKIWCIYITVTPLIFQYVVLVDILSVIHIYFELWIHQSEGNGVSLVLCILKHCDESDSIPLISDDSGHLLRIEIESPEYVLLLVLYLGKSTMDLIKGEVSWISIELAVLKDLCTGWLAFYC